MEIVGICGDQRRIFSKVEKRLWIHGKRGENVQRQPYKYIIYVFILTQFLLFLIIPIFIIIFFF
jgi:hypothetical protein